MELIDGPLYTPEQVCEAGWLGPDATPGGLRKAAGRKPNEGRIEHTRFPPSSNKGRIYFTAANIRAIQAAGLRPAEGPATPAESRRTRRTPTTEMPQTVTVLRPRPEARRRSRKAS